MNSKTSPTILFWIIAVLLLFWSIADLAVFIQDSFIHGTTTFDNGSIITASKGSLPLWYIIVLAFSVITGVIAGALLIWRKRQATTFAILSFAAVLIDIAYTQFSNSVSDEPVYNWDLLFMILFFDMVMVIFTFYSKQKRWII